MTHEGCMNGRLDEWMNKLMNGWMTYGRIMQHDGWTNVWMEECIVL